MGSTLTGQKIKDTYLGFIKTSDSLEVNASGKELTDGNGNDLDIFINTGGQLGFSSTPDFTIDAGGNTDAFRLPNGSTAQQPTGQSGIIRYNTTDSKLEYFDTSYKFIASENYVNTQINNLIDSSPAALDTLNEIAAALNDDPDFYNTINTLINTKQDTVTGAATTIVSSDLTVSRALISNASGKVAVSSVTDTELGYVSGVTSDIQTQIDAKYDKSGGTISGNATITGNLTVDTNTLYIDSTNNRVGIGTDSPAEKLTISDSGQAKARLLSTDNSGVRFDLHSSGGGRYSLQSLANSEFLIFDEANGHYAARYGAGSSGNWRFFTNNTERMRIHSTGDIAFKDTSSNEAFYWDASASSLGIGTDLPAAKLDLVGGDVTGGLKISANKTTSAFFAFGADANETRITSTSYGSYKPLTIYTGGSERMRIHSGGDISFTDTSNNEAFYWDASASSLGIGTDSPSSFSNYSTLTVNGTNGGIINLKVAETETGRLQVFSGAFNIAAKGASTSLLFETNGAERMRITSGGQIEIPNQNAINEIQFTGSQYTNIYSQTTAGFDIGTNSTSGTSYLRLLTEFVERMRIDSGGDISFRDSSTNEAFYWDASASSLGIGTDSPANGVSGLHISVASSTDQLYLERTGSATGRWWLGAAANSLYFHDDVANSTRMIIDSSGNVKINSGYLELGSEGISSGYVYSQESLYFNVDSNNTPEGSVIVFGTGRIGNTGGSELMRITSGGNVGINVNDPDSQLEIVNSSGGSIRLGYAGGTDSYFDSENFYIRSGNGGSNKLIINASGNVGIGTTSPVSTLDVKTSGVTILTANTSGFTTVGDGTGFGVYRSNAGRQSGYSWTIDSAAVNGGADASEYQIDDIKFNIRKQTTDSSLSEVMRISTSGVTTFNASNPTSGQRTFKFDALILKSNYAGGDGQPYTNFGGGLIFNNETYNGTFYDSAAIYGGIGDDSVTTNAGGHLAFYTSTTKTAAPNEKMRIDSSGNVGIGTTNPLEPLHLQRDGTTSYATTTIRNANSTAYLNIGVGGSLVADTPLRNNAYIIVPTAADLLFRTSDTERMRITSGGYLKASNTGSYNNASGTYHEIRTNTSSSDVCLFTHSSSTSPYGIDIGFTGATPNDTTSYFIVGYDASYSRFKIFSNGDMINRNGSYGSYSDIKLKENIVDASPKLDDLMQVRIRNYNLIGEETKQLGVVAQELEEVFPAMVSESPDFEEQEVTDKEGNVTTEKVDLGTTTKSVKYSVFVPMLIKAMQEQQEIINDLKARIETLENQ